MPRERKGPEIKMPDLRPRREAAGLERKELAAMLGVTTFQVYRIEGGHCGASFALALRCVDILGRLTVESDGHAYQIGPSDGQTAGPGSTPPSDSPTLPAIDVDPVAGLLRTKDELHEAFDAMTDLGRCAIGLRAGSPVVAGRLVTILKELGDALFWGNRTWESVKARMPEVCRRAEELTRADLAAEFAGLGMEVGVA